MDKYRNKYRIASARAAWWDYGWNGAYFITICTQNRNHYFGEILDGNMQLSNQGVIAEILWHEIPHHAHHVELGGFVVMPNHIHGILILDKPEIELVGGGGLIRSFVPVETGHDLSLPTPTPTPTPPTPPPPSQTPAQSRFRNQGKNTISSIVGSYKSAVTKHVNRMGLEFGWQTRFYDNIIRSDADYQRINDYIENNPKNWKDDRFYQRWS